MKSFKKILLSIISVLTVVMALSLTVQVKAEEDLTPNFDDDFESYTLGAGQDEMASKWTNAWYQKTGDYNQTACNSDKFKIVADPLDETNKVLYIDTKTDNESFFFLTIKDIMTKDFVLSFDMLTSTNTTESWNGVTCRKPVDGRYNGVTNVLLCTRFWTNNSMSYQTYRSVDDSFALVDAKGLDENGNDLPGYSGQPGEELYNKWFHVEYKAQGTKFSITVNGQLMGVTEITKKTANGYGLVSISSCVNIAYYDNVHLENLDEEPYNQGGSGENNDHKAPTMEETELVYTKGEDLEVPVSLFGEAVTQFKQAANEVMSKYFQQEGDKIIISSEYLDTFQVGSRKMFIITTEGGSVSFYITMPEEKQPEGNTTVAPTTTASNTTTKEEQPIEKPETKGCKGTIIASFGLFAIIGSIAFVSYKKKENN